jgi:restriction endonuclease S subunit
VVLTPIKNENGDFLIDPTLLSVLLRSDLVYGQIIHKVAGIGRPRISAKDLRHVRIPVPPHEDQRALLTAYREQIKAANALRREAQALLEEADSTLSTAINSLMSAACR